MTGKAERAVAGPASEETLPDFADIFDGDSWESRLAWARAKREKALASRQTPSKAAHVGPKGSEAVAEGTAGPINGTERQPGGSALSLDDVIQTKNLKDRLELAQKRHAQVLSTHEPQAQPGVPGLAGDIRADFKKAVLKARPVQAAKGAKDAEPRKADETSAQVLPLILPAAKPAQAEQAPKRRRLAAAIVLIGLGGGVLGAFALRPAASPPVSGVAPQVVAQVPVTGGPEGQPWGAGLGTSGAADAGGLDGTVVAGLGFADPDISQPHPSNDLAQGGPSDLGVVALATPVELGTSGTAGYQPGDLQLPDGSEPPFDLAGILPNTVSLSGPQVPGSPEPLVLSDAPAIYVPTAPRLQTPFQVGKDIIGNFSITPLDQGVSFALNRVALPGEPTLDRTAPAGILARPGEPAMGKGPALAPLIAVSASAPAPFAVPDRISIPDSSWQPGPQQISHWSGLQAATPALADGGHQGAVPAIGQSPAAIITASLPAAQADTTAELAGVQDTVVALPSHEIRVYAPSAVPQEQSDTVLGRLKAAGFSVGPFKSVGFTVSADNVRYYHRTDAATARALADLVHAKARDFTDFSPRPPLGTVELWLAGDTPKAQPRRRVTRRVVRNSDSDSNLRALRDQLVQQLRRGDYLGGGG